MGVILFANKDRFIFGEAFNYFLLLRLLIIGFRIWILLKLKLIFGRTVKGDFNFWEFANKLDFMLDVFMLA
jgi:hypothetical protein